MRLLNTMNARKQLFAPGSAVLTDILSVKVTVDDVYQAWLQCSAVEPALQKSAWPHIVGLVLNAHAIKRLHPDMSYTQLFRNKKAAQQQHLRFTLTVSTEIHKIVKLLWTADPTKKKPRSFPFAKLIEKGMINPKSVRYICPQITRCGDCQQSRKLVTELLHRWLLGSYPHRVAVVSPEVRIQVLKLTFDELLDLVRPQPSKHLYCVVAECIAAVSVSDPEIHIVAASTNPNFAAYVEAVCSNASTIAKSALANLLNSNFRRRRPQLKQVLFTVKPQQHMSKIVQQVNIVPTSAAVRQKQRNIAMKLYGVPDVHAYICNKCSTVHGAFSQKTRGNRMKAGVAINLSDTTDIVCNACNSPVTSQNFVGSIAIMPTDSNVTVCCACGNVSGTISSVGDGLYCHLCKRSAVAGQYSPKCACGEMAAYNATKQDAFIARSSSSTAYAIYTPCAQHLSAVPALISATTKFTPTIDECNQFFQMYQHCTVARA